MVAPFGDLMVLVVASTGDVRTIMTLVPCAYVGRMHVRLDPAPAWVKDAVESGTIFAILHSDDLRFRRRTMTNLDSVRLRAFLAQRNMTSQPSPSWKTALRALFSQVVF